MASFTASCQPAPSRVTDGYLGTLCPTVPIRTFCTVTELFQGIQRIRNLILFKPGDGQSLMTQPSLEHVMQAWSDSGLAWNTPSPTPTSPKAAAMAPTLMASAQSGQKRQGSVHPPPSTSSPRPSPEAKQWDVGRSRSPPRTGLPQEQESPDHMWRLLEKPRSP